MRKEIKTKIAKIVSALGAEPIVRFPGDYWAGNTHYSFSVYKMVNMYPLVSTLGYMFLIVKDGNKILEIGFYYPIPDIVKMLHDL